MAEALDDAFLRVNRAGQHLANLKRGIKRYLDAHEDDLVVKVKGMTLTPPRFPKDPPPRFTGVLIGETVQNLRTALDYLIARLAWMDTGFEDLKRRTQFPIETKPQDFKGRVPRSLEGLSADHVAAIERLQPYNVRNGDSWLMALRNLSNLDKHNILVVAAQAHGTANIAAGLSDAEAIALGGFRRPGDDVSMYYRIPLVITFPDGIPVVELLQLLVAETRAVLEAFKPEFKGWQPYIATTTSGFQIAGPMPRPAHDH